MLVHLGGEVERIRAAHTELWHVKEQRPLEASEVDAAAPLDVIQCLRIETQACGTRAPDSRRRVRALETCERRGGIGRESTHTCSGKFAQRFGQYGWRLRRINLSGAALCCPPCS